MKWNTFFVKYVWNMCIVLWYACILYVLLLMYEGTWTAGLKKIIYIYIFLYIMATRKFMLLIYFIYFITQEEPVLQWFAASPHSKVEKKVVNHEPFFVQPPCSPCVWVCSLASSPKTCLWVKLETLSWM